MILRHIATGLVAEDVQKVNPDLVVATRRKGLQRAYDQVNACY